MIAGDYFPLPTCKVYVFTNVWLANKGFPRGELGDMLGLIYEVKVNGLEYLLKPLIKNEP